mgnify:CR=1 FL=1
MGIEQELANFAPSKETIITIGVFDGVHLGHRYLLENVKRQAQEKRLLSAVVTFNNHPQSVLRPDGGSPWLDDVEEKVRLLCETDIDLVAVISFTLELAQLRAREFISLLKKHLKMHKLVVGPDFALGRDREGDIDLLRSLGQEMNFDVEAIAPVTIGGEIISSTLIRQALAQGDMTKVEKLMGRHFYLIGKVIAADQRGRALGFPTANLDMPPQQALPDNGVYATIAQVDGRNFASATNIGTRPTFGNNKKTVETHLLNYEGNLYGKRIKVEFIQKLREEQNFASPEELKTQIGKDIRQMEIVLSREFR